MRPARDHLDLGGFALEWRPCEPINRLPSMVSTEPHRGVGRAAHGLANFLRCNRSYVVRRVGAHGHRVEWKSQIACIIHHAKS